MCKNVNKSTVGQFFLGSIDLLGDGSYDWKNRSLEKEEYDWDWWIVLTIVGITSNISVVQSDSPIVYQANMWPR